MLQQSNIYTPLLYFNTSLFAKKNVNTSQLLKEAIDSLNLSRKKAATLKMNWHITCRQV